MIVHYGELPGNGIWDVIGPIAWVVFAISLLSFFFFMVIGDEDHIWMGGVSFLLFALSLVVGVISLNSPSEERLHAERALLSQAGYTDVVRTDGLWYAERDGELVSVEIDGSDEPGAYIIREND